MSAPEPDVEGAREAMNDLLGYLDWFTGTTGARLRETNVRAFAWRALTALADPTIQRSNEFQARSRTPHAFTDQGDGFCLWCRWWPGSEAHNQQRGERAERGNNTEGDLA